MTTFELGVHVEGPFICVERIGAHPKQCVRDYENGFSDVLETYGDLTNIAIITLAPEKKNSMEVIEEFCKRGIVVSVG